MKFLYTPVIEFPPKASRSRLVSFEIVNGVYSAVSDASKLSPMVRSASIDLFNVGPSSVLATQS